MADPALHDQIVAYLQQKYETDPTTAEKIWSTLQVPDGARIEDVTFQATQKAVDLGLKARPDPGASPQEVQAGAQQKAADQQQATASTAQQALQIYKQAADQIAQNPDKASDIQASAQQALAAIGVAQSGQTPTQVLQLTGGKDLSPTQLATAIRAYNEHNPGDTLTESDADGFYQRIMANAPGALDALGHVVEGQTKTTFSIWDSQSKSIKDVPVETSYLVAAAGQGGLKILTPAIAAAERTNGIVPWQILHAALVKGGPAQIASDAANVKREYAFGQLEAGDAHGERPVAGADVTAKQLSQLTTKYGDPLLALIALRDPSLADQIFEQGSTTAEQSQKVSQIMLDSGLGSSPNEVLKNLADQGYAANVAKLGAMMQPSSGSGSSVKLPDPESLKEGARQLYRAWFVREPTDTELSQFVTDIDAKVVGSSKPANPFKGTAAVDNSTSVDPSAQLQASLRGNPEYQQLFGQKAAGVSEEDYTNQFRGATSSLLGGALPNPDAVRIGMQTGHIEDSLRYQAGDAASLDNSAFMQRMARAANAIAAVT